MELDWTTFALEIVNFLVLVWLLQRFLYRPVARAIARRRAGIERSMSEAREARAQAEAFQAQFRDRLAGWEREKAQAGAQLHDELEAQRARRMAELSEALERERLRKETVAQREAQERARELEAAALRQGGAFAARLLAALTVPELEARIVELALSELERLPRERREALRAAAAAAPQAAVTSAYELSPDQRGRIAQALADVSGAQLACDYRRDESLLAGLRIELGPWVLGANLRDELSAFAQSGHERD
jgi:F-type H+-transporting ATPase subunit b